MNLKVGEESLPGQLLMNIMLRDWLFFFFVAKENILIDIAEIHQNVKYKTVWHYLHMDTFRETTIMH